jgi:eukaryotic-like serine/threonine-protein kinase
MATVYLARDLRHDRDVAVKVLHSDLAASLGAERFLAEIRTTARLQHPNILPLLDSGLVGQDASAESARPGQTPAPAAGGTPFYVMPYIAGESLRHRLNREQQLPLDDAIRIAKEIAGALEYAHRQGVIHRDIKPENVLLHEGQALVADFGIALAVRSAASSRLTRTGMSLGTPQYMAPEQATGERVIDARADIYALGAVTYEMLVGEPPFTGPTMQAIVTRLMSEEPRSLSVQRRTIPPPVEFAVLKALEKLPADRWATAAEFAAALESPQTTAYHPGYRGPGVPVRAARVWIASLGSALVLVAAVALWGWLRPTATADAVIRLSFVPPLDAELRLERARTSVLALSPDGRRLVYVGPSRTTRGLTQLYLRALDDTLPTPIAGTDSGSSPFFSPDGNWIGFHVGGRGFGGGRIMRVPLSGGAPIEVVSGAQPGAAWSDDGYIIYASGQQLRRVPASGGAPDTLATRDSAGPARGPSLATPLPDGRGVLFRRCTGQGTEQCRLFVIGEKGTPPKDLGVDAVAGWYLPTGDLMYVRSDGAVFGAPFSLSALAVTGPAAPLLDKIGLTIDGSPHLAWSNNGTLAYLPGERSDEGVLAEVDRDGTARPLVSDRATFFSPRVSPDGRNVAVLIPDSRNRRDAHIWIVDRAAHTLTQLTRGGDEGPPGWSPDSRRIAFTSQHEGRSALYVMPADGSQPPDSLSLGAERAFPVPGMSPWWSSASEVAVALVTTPAPEATAPRGGPPVRPNGADSAHVVVVNANGTGTPRQAGATPGRIFGGRVSPDERFVAYGSNESGRSEVYVRPLHGEGARLQVSTAGGTEPVWGPPGGAARTLYYRSGDSLYVAQLSGTTSAMVTSRAAVLADSSSLLARPGTNFDVLPGGGFVIVRPEARAPEPAIVLNWFADVRRRLGGAK